MADIPGKIQRGWREVRGNLAVELAKWLGGTALIGGLYKALLQAGRHVPVDWWLLFSFVLTGVFLVGYSLYQQGERSVHASVEDSEPPVSVHEAARDFATQHNHALYVKTGVQALQIFSPLQLEVFQLSHDLRLWFSGLDLEPVDPCGPKDSIEAVQNHIMFITIGPHGRWVDAVNAGFDLIWKSKIQTLLLRLTESGVSDTSVNRLLERRDLPHERITEVRCRLVCLAHRLSGLEITPREEMG